MLELLLRRRALSRDAPMWIVSACLAVFCASNLAGFLINGVAGGKPNRLVPLLTLLGLPFLYSVLTQSRKREIAFAAVAGSMIASYLAAIAALYQYYVDRNFRAEGLTGNALVFGHTVTLAGCLCLAGLLMGYGSWQGRRLQPALAGGFIASIIALILSGSRIYWMVLVVAVGCIVLVCWRRGQRISWPGALIGLLAAGIIAMPLFAHVRLRFEELWQNWHAFASEGRYDTSLGLRLRLWELGTSLVRQHPWIGTGIPSNKPLIEAGLKRFDGLEASFSHFHNGFLTAAVEAGMIGLAALLCAMATLGVIAFRALRAPAGAAEKFGGVMLMVLLLTALISGSFNILIGHDILDAVFMTWVCVGLFLASGTAVRDGGDPLTGALHLGEDGAIRPADRTPDAEIPAHAGNPWRRSRR